MAWSAILQVFGAVLELGGILTVALGITDTRDKFDPDNLGWIRGASAAIRRGIGRLLGKKRPIVAQVGAAAEMSAVGSLRSRGTVGFGPWSDEDIEARVERLRRAIEIHEKELTDLHGRIDNEANARSDADERQIASTEALRGELMDLVRDAAAGGLRLETIGVSLFAGASSSRRGATCSPDPMSLPRRSVTERLARPGEGTYECSETDAAPNHVNGQIGAWERPTAAPPLESRHRAEPERYGYASRRRLR